MKKHLLVLAFVMVGFTAFTAGAQPAQPPKPSFDGAMEKLFGDNPNFSATMEFHCTPTGGNEITMPGKVAHVADKSRFDMDMSKVLGASITPEMAAQIKKMGMGRMTTITRTDKKVTYIVYPDMKAYVETATKEASVAPSDYKSEVTKLGAESVDGHDCVKNKVVVTGPDGVPHESTVWNASDLKQFPIKIQMISEKGGPAIMFFKDVKLDKPDDAQFDLPSDYKKYDDVMSLMMSRMPGAPSQ